MSSKDILVRQFETTRTIVRRISSAEILTLRTSPTIVVPAPGPNKMLIPTLGVFVYYPGTVQYSNVAQSLYLKFQNGGTIQSYESSGLAVLINQTVKTIQIAGYTEGVRGDWASNYENLPLVLTTNDSDPTTGNGELDAIITYIEFDV